MRKITATLATIVFAAYLTAPAAAQGVDVAIVFVADASSSMHSEEREYVRYSHAVALTSDAFLEGLAQTDTGHAALAYVEFSTTGIVAVDWTRVGSPDDLEAFASRVLAVPDTGGSSTSIGAGLWTALRLIDALPWPAERIVVDVVGDGGSNAPPSPDEPRAELMRRGVTINGAPIVGWDVACAKSPMCTGGDLEAYYRTHVVTPDGFVQPVAQIDQMPAALRRKIVTEAF